VRREGACATKRLFHFQALRPRDDGVDDCVDDCVDDGVDDGERHEFDSRIVCRLP
jgi:hypothetical protein